LLQQIVDADRLSQERHQGHGNAIAQRTATPFCRLDARDKETQVCGVYETLSTTLDGALKACGCQRRRSILPR
jgi:hypothetical protein